MELACLVLVNPLPSYAISSTGEDKACPRTLQADLEEGTA